MLGKWVIWQMHVITDNAQILLWSLRCGNISRSGCHVYGLDFPDTMTDDGELILCVNERTKTQLIMSATQITSALSFPQWELILWICWANQNYIFPAHVLIVNREEERKDIKKMCCCLMRERRLMFGHPALPSPR